MSLLQSIVLVPALALTYAVLKIFYNLFLHPLRSYPGPIIGRATALYSDKATISGNLPQLLHHLHLKYGPVVRITPNELSFIDADVWKDVYGHHATAFEKDKMFYGPDSYGTPAGIIRADNAAHARQRKLVSHAFSDKALRDQEALLKGYAELLVTKLKELGAKGMKTDLVKWYNFTTFDIMGDLAFGEPLKLLEDAKYTPWVNSVFGHIRLVAISQVIRRWGFDKLFQMCIPMKAKEQRKTHMRFSSDRVDARLAKKTDRPDIWTYVLRHSEDEEHKGKGLHPTEMHSNGAIFMLAGTETTATELSGLTYFLLKNPAKMARLQEEIRTAFSTLDDLHMNELSKLTYLNACLEEGLRMYPPVPVGLPRTTPRDGAQVAGSWVAGGTTVMLPQYAAYHSPSNFKDPETFVPERWLPEGQAEYGSDHKDVLQPFSYGPRNCLGKNLAYHEMRLILASVLLNFDLELCEEAEGWPKQENFILWSKGPLMVRLKAVN
ncbi:benzoate 4-monooxygenase cytochrome P450 [Lentithecium fluviatile CBS 122367]|uniref:Benzoate 4-monooxygenase cytochrome P450 n=1 Tax=Lentithecium fluviatile CBS 122367 TaxID=1168545 RepID=A0A6G1IEF5_9PLEO|nr:benzoate 4-monooxygenase cytochrome P450 [Lentithecium fluviatile CBS 122367]